MAHRARSPGAATKQARQTPFSGPHNLGFAELQQLPTDHRPVRTAEHRGVAHRFERHRRIGQLKPARVGKIERSEEHTSELQSLMRSSYAVFCLKKKIKMK